MHLIFERSKGRFKSNCNILALAWTPYYNEAKFRQALFDYHQRQLINLTISDPIPSVDANQDRDQIVRVENELARRGVPVGERSSPRGQPAGELVLPNNNQFLNSRVAELYTRYLYLKSKVPSSNAISVNDELESKYGCLPDFGWLVIGNIGKIVGITLTSVVKPPERIRPKGRRLCSDESENLMLFNDVDAQENENAGQDTIGGEFDKNRPDLYHKRKNYNLRGHLDEIILVKWNELYQKLATIDSKGNVLIWCKINEKFTIQTPFYNRTKSVADFKWSNDGKTALICYTDSFILVGSSTGQRHWHSMLNLDDYHITCASWTPNDEQLLLGVSNGNVVVIDLPRSELTEITVNQINIRTMCWSSCEVNLKSISKLIRPPLSNVEASANKSRRSSVVVNHRRLSRDCSVFSRYRFCSRGPNTVPCSNANTLFASGKDEEKTSERNLLSIDFADNTIRLYNGGLDDPEPRTIHVNQESYIMHWSSDGRVLAVAGFNIHTTAPSVGCLKCRYANAIKFYNQSGELIYQHSMKYTRYPITAFTWAHDDTRLFLATGPRLHCAKVFFGVPPLSLLTLSCFQQNTRLPAKCELVDAILNTNNRYNVADWQSHNCPISTQTGTMKSSSNQNSPERDRLCNNSVVYQYQLPYKLKCKIDDLFDQTILQPFDDTWTLNDIAWQVPRNDQRYFCTLICYTSDRDFGSSGCQYRSQAQDRSSGENHAGDQNKIFVLYIEFQGSLIPILRARRIGFLKPEFVIFDPDDGHHGYQRPRKISDLSQQMLLKGFIQRRFDNQQANLNHSLAGCSQYYHNNEAFPNHYLDFNPYSETRDSRSSSLGRQSLGDAEHYYNFESESAVRRHNQDKMADLGGGRSCQQEPLPMNSPYLMYMMSVSPENNVRASPMPPKSYNPRRTNERYKSAHRSSLSETTELVRVRSNIWGTKFKIINVGNKMIRQRSILGTVVYKASILHLQPRQIFLNVKDMSNYCCLCSKHHHSRNLQTKQEINQCKSLDNQVSLIDLPNLDGSRYCRERRGRVKSRTNNSGSIGSPFDDKKRLERKKPNRTHRPSTGTEFQEPSTSKDNTYSPSTRSQYLNFSRQRNRTPDGVSQQSNKFNSSEACRKANYQSSLVQKYTETDNQDDILTLSLDQGDLVKVEMSSIRSNLDQTEREEAANKASDNGDFLADNKTLKSIQTITKMILDLSSKADVDEDDVTKGEICNKADSFNSASYITPDPPLHKPRRLNPRALEEERQSSRQTRSAHSTPQRVRYRRQKSNDLSFIPSNPLPQPPPAAMPVSRKLSLTMKRMFDDSLRSIYGNSYASDIEHEESEPLVSRSQLGYNGFSRSIVKHMRGRSQPSSPMRNLEQQKAPVNFGQLSSQLLQRVRGFTANEKKSSTSNSTSRLEWLGGEQNPRAKRTANLLELSDSGSDVFVDSSDTDSEIAEFYNKPKAYKRGISSSVKDLRDLAGQKSSESERKLAGARKNKERCRKKSICPNPNCCCARELKLINRTPVWNEQSQVYQLDFGGRVTQESAKNLQIEHEGNLALQFGRMDHSTYTLDYKFPFNAIQAMSIALASLTQRLK